MKKLDKLKIGGTVKNTFILSVGTLISSFFSYLLQVTLGKFLTVNDFGSFNALLSVSYLLAVPATVFTVALVKIVAEHGSKEEFGKLTLLFRKLLGFSLSIGTLMYLISFFLKTNISNYLKIYNPKAVSLFGLWLGLSFFSSLLPAFLQGLQKYKQYSIYNVLSSMFRLFFPTILVLLGAGLGGVFLGMTASTLVVFLIGLFFISSMFTDFSNLEIKASVKKILHFSFPVLFINFGLMILNNIDVIVVKRFFDPVIAGYYAGTVTLGKILLFGAGTVGTVMFPQISALYARNEGYTKKFRELFVLQVLIVSIGVLVFTFFPKFLTVLFFGKKFIHSVEYLPAFAVFIGLYVLINFIVLYFLAIEKTSVFLVLLPGILFQVYMLLNYHSSIYEIIRINIFVCIITLVLLSLFQYFNEAKKKRKK